VRVDSRGRELVPKCRPLEPEAGSGSVEQCDVLLGAAEALVERVELEDRGARLGREVRVVRLQG
jgi:hypothetical protein